MAPIHVLTTSTLDRLGDLYPQGRFEMQRFRPNNVMPHGGGYIQPIVPYNTTERLQKAGTSAIRVMFQKPYTKRCSIRGRAHMDCLAMLWLIRSLDDLKCKGGIPHGHAVVKTLLRLRTALVKASRDILHTDI